METVPEIKFAKSLDCYVIYAIQLDYLLIVTLVDLLFFWGDLAFLVKYQPSCKQKVT